MTTQINIANSKVPATQSAATPAVLSKGLKEIAGDAARRRLFDVVRTTLRRAGMRQVDVATALSLSPSTVSRMLSRPHNLTVENAGRLMMATGCWLDFQAAPIKQPINIYVYQHPISFHGAFVPIQPFSSGSTLVWHLMVEKASDYKTSLLSVITEADDGPYNISIDKAG